MLRFETSHGSSQSQSRIKCDRVVSKSSNKATECDDRSTWVKSERIIRLKKSRSSAKAVLTKKQRELTELMNNPSNVDQVRVKVSEFGLAVKKFNEVHDRYHAENRDENAIRDSNEYFGAVDDMVRDIISEIDLWLQSVQVKLQEKIDFSISLHPEDSISNIGTVKSNVSETSHVSKSKTVTSSRLSRASSSGSARLKASAKKEEK